LIKILTNQYPNVNTLFKDQVDFPTQLTLSHDAYRSLTVKNAGGKSAISEALSIEYFTKAFNATSIILEMEIDYCIDYKMVDFICAIRQYKVGVSVTRAMGYPTAASYTLEQATTLLKKKLTGLIIARNGVNKRHNFYKSILHIWCQSTDIANLLEQAYSDLNFNEFGLDIKGIVILLLTICPDPIIYKNLHHTIISPVF